MCKSYASRNKAAYTQRCVTEKEGCYAGAEGLSAFVHALHKSIWIDGVNAIPPENFTEDEVVSAAELYPDIQYTSIDGFYRSQTKASKVL